MRRLISLIFLVFVACSSGPTEPGPTARIISSRFAVQSDGSVQLLLSVQDGYITTWSATEHLSNPVETRSASGRTSESDRSASGVLVIELGTLEQARCPVRFDWEVRALEPPSVSGSDDAC